MRIYSTKKRETACVNLSRIIDLLSEVVSDEYMRLTTRPYLGLDGHTHYRQELSIDNIIFGQALNASPELREVCMRAWEDGLVTFLHPDQAVMDVVEENEQMFDFDKRRSQVVLKWPAQRILLEGQLNAMRGNLDRMGLNDKMRAQTIGAIAALEAEIEAFMASKALPSSDPDDLNSLGREVLIDMILAYKKALGRGTFSSGADYAAKMNRLKALEETLAQLEGKDD